MSDETRWLSRAEQRTWLAVNGVTLLLPYALEAQMQRDHGLAAFEYGVLSALSEAPDRRLRMKVLAGMANGSLSRLSHVVTRLEKRGLVRREPSAEDGRTTMAVLTDAGWDTIVGAAPSHVEEVRSLVLDPLTDEEAEVLGRACLKILRRVLPLCEVPEDLMRRLEEVGGPCPEDAAPARSAR